MIGNSTPPYHTPLETLNLLERLLVEENKLKVLHLKMLVRIRNLLNPDQIQMLRNQTHTLRATPVPFEFRRNVTPSQTFDHIR